jgi:hypothetical protein
MIHHGYDVENPFITDGSKFCNFTNVRSQPISPLIANIPFLRHELKPTWCQSLEMENSLISFMEAKAIRFSLAVVGILSGETYYLVSVGHEVSLLF